MLALTSTRVLLPDSPPQPATIFVDTTSGKIVEIVTDQRAATLYRASGCETFFDAGTSVLIPGLVDSHVHLNEPGRTDWEGFRTGTRAAAAGGLTAVVDMPLNSIPPTTSPSNLDTKRRVAEAQCWTDIAFWGGLIPANKKHLRPMINAGVKGFKCFTIASGADEFPCVSEADIEEAMLIVEGLDTTLLFHAELERPTELTLNSDPRLYSTFLQSRPSVMEQDAIAMIIELMRRHPTIRCHIVHLSASEALPLIRAAKDEGLRLTVETCFHYLCLKAEAIPAGRPEFKCCPPIRSEFNREQLWTALLDGTIDFVVSDHSPCIVSLKNLDSGDIVNAWGGISSLGLGLSLLWTEAWKRKLPVEKLIPWLSSRTAAFAGLNMCKGALAIGMDADIAVFDTDIEWVVGEKDLEFKNKLSPYEGMLLRGRVRQTYLRGMKTWDIDSGGCAVHAMGKLI